MRRIGVTTAGRRLDIGGSGTVRIKLRGVEKQTAGAARRLIARTPRAADVLRERIRGGNLGLRDPRSIMPARNTLFAMFGGKVPLRQAVVKPGTTPYLVARVALNRNVLLQAAANAVKSVAGARYARSLSRVAPG